MIANAGIQSHGSALVHAKPTNKASVGMYQRNMALFPQAKSLDRQDSSGIGPSLAAITLVQLQNVPFILCRR